MNDEQSRRQRIYDRLHDVYLTSPAALEELERAGPDSIQLAEPRPLPIRRLLLAGAAIGGVVAVAAWWVVR